MVFVPQNPIIWVLGPLGEKFDNVVGGFGCVALGVPKLEQVFILQTISRAYGEMLMLRTTRQECQMKS